MLSISLIERLSAAPPPLPAVEEDADRFGAAAEDGLRMLAALEAMPSLEPDFGEDLAAEASVTIIERATIDTREEDRRVGEAAPAGSLRARLGEIDAPYDIDPDEYAAYQGPVEEAMVEIVEAGEISAGPPPEHDALPAARGTDVPVARRFLKALTGRSD